MHSRRVLVADDELPVCRVYCRLLQVSGYSCDASHSGYEALTKAASSPPDLILLDISMPGMDGIECCRRLRAAPATSGIPVLFMTGTHYPQSLLDLAAAGLGTEPVFHKGEDNAILLRRVRRAMRSGHKPAGPTTRGVAVDWESRRIWVKGREVPRLPTRRFDVLSALLRNQRPLSRGELLQRFWGESDNLNAVDVTICRLRQDLANFGCLRIELGPDGYRAVIDGDNTLYTV